MPMRCSRPSQRSLTTPEVSMRSRRTRVSGDADGEVAGEVGRVWGAPVQERCGRVGVVFGGKAVEQGL